jgi:hypothetical protein
LSVDEEGPGKGNAVSIGSLLSAIPTGEGLSPDQSNISDRMVTVKNISMWKCSTVSILDVTTAIFVRASPYLTSISEAL